MHFLVTAQNHFLISNRSATRRHSTHFFEIQIHPLLLHCNSPSAQTRSQAALPSRFGCGCRGNSSCSPFDVGAASVAKKEKRGGDASGRGLGLSEHQKHHRDAEAAARVHPSQRPATPATPRCHSGFRGDGRTCSGR